MKIKISYKTLLKKLLVITIVSFVLSIFLLLDARLYYGSNWPKEISGAQPEEIGKSNDNIIFYPVRVWYREDFNPGFYVWTDVPAEPSEISLGKEEWLKIYILETVYVFFAVLLYHVLYLTFHMRYRKLKFAWRKTLIYLCVTVFIMLCLKERNNGFCVASGFPFWVYETGTQHQHHGFFLLFPLLFNLALTWLSFVFLGFLMSFINAFRKKDEEAPENGKVGKSEIFLLAFGVILASYFISEQLSVEQGSHWAKTRSQILKVNIAVWMYKDRYGRYPFGDKNTDSKLTTNEYDELMELLTGEDGPDPDNIAGANKDNIKYLCVTENYNQKGYLDPWGSRYNIIVDFDGDGIIKLGDREFQGKIMIYSSGPNKKDNNGRLDDMGINWEDGKEIRTH